ncbi:MAG: beta-ketoacyl-[acyl-carrier-protein] synthase family protein [Nitrospiraceae bacterium]|nr:beta-ketoacyl-[acyl-carrier-protein] synthase family protein [Nitrospiraceae bacterium]
MKRIVVTGIGAVTPFGGTFESSCSSAFSSISGIGQVTRFDAKELGKRVVAEVKNFDRSAYFSDKDMLRSDPFAQYAVVSAFMAILDSGLISEFIKVKDLSSAITPKFKSNFVDYIKSGGVIIGSSRGGITSIEKSLKNNRRLSPYLMPSTTVSSAASMTAQMLEIKGYCLGISNACASGANAIGEAYRLLKSGYQGPVLAGGAEAPICRLCFDGYGSAGALSKGHDSTSSRPFDVSRDGFVLGEGACVLVLEEYEAALKRGVKIYGEIIGYGNSSDAFHQTKPDPEGEARTISLALDDAKIKPEVVDYISAHAASTKLGDKAEAEAIRRVFGNKAANIFVSAVKSMTGHMLSASGAFEAGVTLMSLKHGIITPTINLKNIDPDCRLNHITKPMKSDIKTAISNSFGFGGVNAVLVFKKV